MTESFIIFHDIVINLLIMFIESDSGDESDDGGDGTIIAGIARGVERATAAAMTVRPRRAGVALSDGEDGGESEAEGIFFWFSLDV